MPEHQTFQLDAANVLLGVACLAVALTAVGGVIYEFFIRRKMRAPLPDGWPPTAAEGGEHDAR